MDFRRLRRSPVWEFFQNVDIEKKTAICCLCSGSFSYLSTISNLKRHLSKHGLDLRKSKRNTSLKSYVELHSVWEYFNKLADEETVVCIICNETVQHESEQNLLDHLEEKHNDMEIIENYSDEESYDTEIGNKLNTKVDDDSKTLKVWNQFTKISEKEKIAECKLCKMIVSFDDENNIVEHLKTRHMHIQSEEENIILGSEYKNPQPSNKIGFQKTRKRKHDDRHDDLNTFQDDKMEVYSKIKAAATHDDSLDHFSKYIVSLLKELPEDLSAKLQLDFIMQINEKRAKERKKPVSPDAECDSE